MRSRVHEIETCTDSAQMAHAAARERQYAHHSADEAFSRGQVMRLTSLIAEMLQACKKHVQSN